MLSYYFSFLQSQLWSFIPKQEQKYVMKPALVVWGQGFSSTSSGGKKKQFDVRAVGEGSIGDIKVGHKIKLQCKFLKNECLEKQ